MFSHLRVVCFAAIVTGWASVPSTSSAQEVSSADSNQVLDSKVSDVADQGAKPEATSSQEGWLPLVSSPELKDAKLGEWEKTNFGGEGEVSFLEGILKMKAGRPMTGIHLKQKDVFPKENYEIRWKAQRVQGSDFFACLTVPIGDEHCSFICGGWGGGLVGVSSINGNDASENQAATFHNFKNKQWYSFRLRVDAKRLQVWIDDEEVVDVERDGNTFTVRAEVRACRPLGYCVFESDVEVKDWEYRLLSEEETNTESK